MLVMAQAASFWHLKSPLPSTSTNGRITLLVMRAWIWMALPSAIPPAMLDTVQAASLTMFILEWTSNLASNGQAPAARTESVWISLLVTIFPIVLRVGVGPRPPQRDPAKRQAAGRLRRQQLPESVRWGHRWGTARPSKRRRGSLDFVVVVDQVGQGGKKWPDGRDTGPRILVTTQVGQSPSDIT